MSEADIKRLFQELAAAPTRAEAEEIFWGADWVFLHMKPTERERIYNEIEDAISEKIN